MLVCKSWRSIIIESSALWGNICIILGDDDDEVVWPALQHKYLDLCLPRSGDAALRITIEIRDMLYLDTYIAQKLREAFQAFTPANDLTRFINSMDWEGTPMFKGYYPMFSSLVEKTLGSEGINMARCYCFNLRLGDDSYLPEFILPLLAHKAPNLKHLNLLSDGVIAKQKKNLGIFAPNLIRVALAGAFDLYSIPYCRELQDLEFPLNSWDGIERLDRLTTLRNLCITVEATPIKASPVQSITLPHLEHLHLRERFPINILQLFQVTNLRKLTLEDGRYYSTTPPSFPQAHLLETVECVIYCSHLPWLRHPNLDRGAMESLLRNFFSKLTKARIIGVPALTMDVAVAIAEEYREDYKLPNLQFVRGVNASGEFLAAAHPFKSLEMANPRQGQSTLKDTGICL
jgi:hypothetical protein